MTSRQAKLEAFGRLLDILDELREKCPWDRKQTAESLRPQTVEETYELSDAILRGDGNEVSKELGDVLLHVVFYAKISSEKGEYDIVDVINRLCDKLVYRHPHVFGQVHVDGADQVVQNWEELKTKEKDGNKRVLSGVPVTLPPLLKAYRMQDKARAVGFDWEERSRSSGSSAPNWTGWTVRIPSRLRGLRENWEISCSRWSMRQGTTT